MKVLLYFENQKLMSKSGIGRAFDHQRRALASAGIVWTTDPYDSYDIIHINTYGFNSGAIVRNARQKGAKVVYHCHSTKEDFRNSFLLWQLIAPFYNHRIVHCYQMGDVLITPTPYSKSLLESYGLKQKIYPISNGIDLERYQPMNEKIKAYRKYFDIRDGEKVVLGVGLLFQRKGILDFIEVAKKLPEYKFIWFGGISKLLIPPKIAYAVNHPPENVYFPGYVKGPIIEGAYSDADCFFFPSYEETEGIVVLEALASKCPVIVRNIGVFEPWLKDGLNCYKCEDNESFAQRIQSVVENTIPSTIEEGYKIAKERSIEAIGQELKQIYEDVLKEN